MRIRELVYLIHFDRPLKHALHYVGCTENPARRFWDHATGNGAAILRACLKVKIDWTIVRMWTGNYAMEGALKARKNSRLYCPLCNPAFPAILANVDAVPDDLLNTLQFPLRSDQIRTWIQST